MTSALQANKLAGRTLFSWQKRRSGESGEEGNGGGHGSRRPVLRRHSGKDSSEGGHRPWCWRSPEVVTMPPAPRFLIAPVRAVIPPPSPLLRFLC